MTGRGSDLGEPPLDECCQSSEGRQRAIQEETPDHSEESQVEQSDDNNLDSIVKMEETEKDELKDLEETRSDELVEDSSQSEDRVASMENGVQIKEEIGEVDAKSETSCDNEISEDYNAAMVLGEATMEIVEGEDVVLATKSYLYDEDFEVKLNSVNKPKRKRKRKKQSTKRGKKAHTQCQLCGEYYAGADSLRRHWHVVHEGRRNYSCSHCERTFSCKGDKTKHEMTHTGDYPFYCPDCGKGLSTSTRYKDHLNTHTKEQALKCPHCSKVLCNQRSLKRHVEALHNEIFGLARANQASYIKCDLCEELLAGPSSLRRHQQVVHEKLKTHVCPYCGKAFSNKRDQMSHEMRHTGNYPYVCSECGKGSSTASRFKSHLAIHTKVSEHVCSHCGKTLCNEKSLKRHIDVIHRFPIHKKRNRPLNERMGYRLGDIPESTANHFILNEQNGLKEEASRDADDGVGGLNHIYSKLEYDEEFPVGKPSEATHSDETEVQSSQHECVEESTTNIKKDVKTEPTSGDEESEDITEPSTGSEVTYTCDVCGETSSSRVDHRKHMRQDHFEARYYPCNQCRKIFGCITGLRKHQALWRTRGVCAP